MFLNNTVIRRYRVKYAGKSLDSLSTLEIVELAQIMPSFEDFVNFYEEEMCTMSFLDRVRFYMELIFYGLVDFPNKSDIIDGFALIESIEWVRPEDKNEYFSYM